MEIHIQVFDSRVRDITPAILQSSTYMYIPQLFSLLPLRIMRLCFTVLSVATLYTIHYHIYQRCNHPCIFSIARTKIQIDSQVTSHRVSRILVLRGSCRREG